MCVCVCVCVYVCMIIWQKKSDGVLHIIELICTNEYVTSYHLVLRYLYQLFLMIVYIYFEFFLLITVT
jgi:hypothetical protein